MKELDVLVQIIKEKAREDGMQPPLDGVGVDANSANIMVSETLGHEVDLSRASSAEMEARNLTLYRILDIDATTSPLH
jgi:hypothetical protein